MRYVRTFYILLYYCSYHSYYTHTNIRRYFYFDEASSRNGLMRCDQLNSIQQLSTGEWFVIPIASSVVVVTSRSMVLVFVHDTTCRGSGDSGQDDGNDNDNLCCCCSPCSCSPLLVVVVSASGRRRRSHRYVSVNKTGTGRIF